MAAAMGFFEGAMMANMEGRAVDESGNETEIVAETTHDLERVFREDGPGVWRTIFAYSGGRRDVADDVVAEAFARAIEHAGTIREPAPWVYRVAFRLAREEMKGERRRTAAEVEGIIDPTEVSDLMPALRKLSPHQRAVIVMHYEADLPVAEIADRLGMASATVRVHLHRGRARLRELLGTEEEDR
jgi:RNA polymerase sigma-70 factor (ECF subfamily)